MLFLPGLAARMASAEATLLGMAVLSFFPRPPLQPGDFSYVKNSSVSILPIIVLIGAILEAGKQTK